MKYVEAEKSYLKALELNPELHGAIYNIGILYIDNEMPDHGVIQRFEKAIKNLNDYKTKVTVTKEEDEVIAGYLATAEKEIVKEQKRDARRLKREERKRKKAEKARLKAEAEAAEAAAEAEAAGLPAPGTEGEGAPEGDQSEANQENKEDGADEGSETGNQG